MHIKIEGYFDPEKIKEILENVLIEAEKETGKKVFFRGADLYLRLEDEKGTQVEYVEPGLMAYKNLPDRFVEEVYQGLLDKKKQVTIASELGITPTRVGKIKKYLKELDLLP